MDQDGPEWTRMDASELERTRDTKAPRRPSKARPEEQRKAARVPWEWNAPGLAGSGVQAKHTAPHARARVAVRKPNGTARRPELRRPHRGAAHRRKQTAPAGRTKAQTEQRAHPEQPDGHERRARFAVALWRRGDETGEQAHRDMRE